MTLKISLAKSSFCQFNLRLSATLQSSRRNFLWRKAKKLFIALFTRKQGAQAQDFYLIWLMLVHLRCWHSNGFYFSAFFFSLHGAEICLYFYGCCDNVQTHAPHMMLINPETNKLNSRALLMLLHFVHNLRAHFQLAHDFNYLFLTHNFHARTEMVSLSDFDQQQQHPDAIAINNKHYQFHEYDENSFSENENSDVIQSALNRGPYFEVSASRNVTALVGSTAYLNCRVRNLGNKTVWIFLALSSSGERCGQAL